MTANVHPELPQSVQGHARWGALSSGLPMLVIDHPTAEATVALQGAQVLHWQPAEHDPVLWQTRRLHSQPGRSVRGGIPICWPWFGPGTPGQGAHGFARSRDWSLTRISADTEGVHLQLQLRDDAQTRQVWANAFELVLDVDIGAVLSLSLTTRNRGDEPLRLTQALHSYFACGDIGLTQVLGLDATPYTDKVQAGRLEMQQGPVRFVGETDRVYGPTSAECLIEDPVLARRIRVAKSGSQSTVVWSPWLDKAATLGDMEATEYRQMLCVETANAGDDVVLLAPAEQHTLGLRISVEPMPPAPVVR